MLGVYLPLAFGGLIDAAREVPQLVALSRDLPPVVTTWTFYVDALLVSVVLFFGALVLGLLVVGTVPRLLNLARPARTRSTRFTACATRSTGRSRG